LVTGGTSRSAANSARRFCVATSFDRSVSRSAGSADEAPRIADVERT
jgi:hypothetical protein